MKDKKKFRYIKPNLFDKLSCKLKDPKISVIVASFNYANFITATLDSIVNQSYKNFEVIIVDDGSTDGSLEIIKKYTKKFDNVFLYTHENYQNRGLPETIKLGISKSRGEYIAFCESDDFWDTLYLKKKIEVINSYRKVAIISNDVTLIGSAHAIVNQMFFLRNYFDSNIKKIKFAQMQRINYIPTFSCAMVKKSVLEKCNFDTPINAWLDFWLWNQIVPKHRMFYLRERLVYWRICHNSLSNHTNMELYNKRKKIWNDHLEKMNVVLAKKLFGKRYKGLKQTLDS
ncbi:MAG: glycosyltransferase [Elusimicrobiota bacterium]|jgi:glycosyltransferase involved in cell wall biosynthesis|nr:glycosyltransferase [Elusimicrobiota bacterium]